MITHQHSSALHKELNILEMQLSYNLYIFRLAQQISLNRLYDLLTNKIQVLSANDRSLSFCNARISTILHCILFDPVTVIIKVNVQTDLYHLHCNKNTKIHLVCIVSFLSYI